jgi:hypothetical protein
MPEEAPTLLPPSTEQTKLTESPPSMTITPIPPASESAQDRTELLVRARTFLDSLQILDQDVAAKRKFLSEKGLNEQEVEGLLREPVRASWVLNYQLSC